MSAKLPTNPALWQQVKKKARATSEGSPPGRWSSRKAALAQVAYKQQGGEWKTTPDQSKRRQQGQEGSTT